jgi:Shikimate 5-dehydrogenase
MRCGLLGEKLGHSYSPAIHAMLADYEYRLYEKSPDELEDFLLRGDWDGLNVTIPYKKAVMPHLDRIADEARRIGSVNTIVKEADGSLSGYNTDYFGFSAMLDRRGFALAGKKVVILGSGDIGLIMARRLTLEGAEVLGVYEVKPTPSGLARNIQQCLRDFDIPLYLSHTVTRVFGEDRLTGVEIAKVDENMRPIEGTEQYLDCDALILSVGLIPENEISETLGVEIDAATRGPRCNKDQETSIPGVFSCGNSLQVFDLVDYVSDSGELAGTNAAEYAKGTYIRSDKARVPVPLEEPAGDMAPNQMVCITCPKGCLLTVDREEDGSITVTGNRCPRGELFAINELSAPKRTICSTVRTAFPETPVLPVRVSTDIPKEKIFDVMNEIDKVCVTMRVSRGDILIRDVLGTGADVIATSDLLQPDA